MPTFLITFFLLILINTNGFCFMIRVIAQISGQRLFIKQIYSVFLTMPIGGQFYWSSKQKVDVRRSSFWLTEFLFLLDRWIESSPAASAAYHNDNDNKKAIANHLIAIIKGNCLHLKCRRFKSIWTNENHTHKSYTIYISVIKWLYFVCVESISSCWSLAVNSKFPEFAKYTYKMWLLK